jgi:hypothetical protein
MTELFCKDCKHSRVIMRDRLNLFLEDRYRLRCGLRLIPEKIGQDVVTGKPEVTISTYRPCYIERGTGPGNKDNHCGPAGINWEPRKKKDLFKLFFKKYK